MVETIDNIKQIIRGIRKTINNDCIKHETILSERMNQIDILEKLQWDIEKRMDEMVEREPCEV
ncbi:MAG TPA: hypothetical protein VIK78_14640 [Ruminiclostridium sp.]